MTIYAAGWNESYHPFHCEAYFTSESETQRYIDKLDPDGVMNYRIEAITVHERMEDA